MNPSDIHANKFLAHRSSGTPRLTDLQRYGLAFISVGIALGLSLLLQHYHFRVPPAVMLFAVAISSWYAGRGPGVLAAILSIISIYWYFVEPVRTIYIYWSDIPYFIILTAFALLLSWFGAVRRRIEAELRERADLLNLTHDTVFVMDMDGIIKYWNHGAEERYGWTADQAVGRAVHDLLKTVFPAPLEEIKVEVTRTGRWEGELLQTKKDGSQLVAASRWSLERGERGKPVAILETNNDITERKRAEEALRRLNRELRALSNCNQTLLRATNEQGLLEKICRIVCDEAGYGMAFVAYAEYDEAKSVRPVALMGADEGYLATVGLTWADTERGRGPTGTAIRTGKSCCIQDFATDPRLAPWRESVLQRGFRSGIGLPLKDEHDNAFGCLSIYSTQPNAFSLEEIRLLEELAGDLAFGITTLRSRAAREQAEQEVALLNFALNNVREAALLIDDTARFHYVNDEACRVLGYTQAELLQMGVPDIDPEFPARRWSDHWRELKAQRSLSFESRHRTREGRTFPVEISANYFEYGGRSYNLALVRDITERKQAQEALEQERRLFISGPNVAYRVRAAAGWPLEYVSPNMMDQFGYAPEALVREKIPAARLIHPDDLPQVAKEIEAHSNAGESYFSVEFRMVHANGECRWVYDFVVVQRDANGLITHYYGYLTDITERKRAEETLRRSRTYLAEAQKLSHTGSWVSDGRSRETLFWSEEMFRIFGFDPNEGLPKRDQSWQRIHLEDRARVKEASDRTFREKIDYDVEYRIVLPDGTVKHIHSIGHPVLNADRDIVEVIGTNVDITERKHAEEALRESETRFRTFVDHTADAFFMLDFEDGTIIDVNRPACESLGCSREDLIGKTPLAFDVDLDRATFESIADRAAAGETVFFDRHRHRRKDGSTFPVEVHTSVFHHGGRRFLLKVARDISDRLRAEEQRDKLRQLEADLAHMNRVSMLGELTASIAHEINQPLSGVVSNGSACLRWLAGDTPNMEEARETARRIVRDGKRAGEVIARIRALTKKTEACREKVDLNGVIREVLALVGDEATKNRVAIRTGFANDIFLVLGDRVQLQQVVLNLVMNGIEAMSSAGVQARELAITTRNVDSDQVQVTVQDSGKGLDPDTMPKIFDPFFSTKPSGMGMGLSISRSILQAHGGQLWAAANDGPGMSFHFTLPRYDESSHAAA